MEYTKLFNLPPNASAHGHEIDMIIYLVHALMLILLVGWGTFYFVALARFRSGKNPKADYKGVKSHLSSKLEVAVVVVEAVLLIGFSIPFWSKQINAFPEKQNVFEVKIIAEQFAWNVHYSGPDEIFGKSAPEFFDKQTNPMGLDRSDPNGKDDITTINQLHVPIGVPVIVHLTSRDVIHSFSIPVMRVKQDVIPGMSIPTWFTPTKTGKFEIACAQLCGLGHYRMKGFVTVHSAQDFVTWMESQAAPQGEEYDDFWN